MVWTRLLSLPVVLTLIPPFSISELGLSVAGIAGVPTFHFEKADPANFFGGWWVVAGIVDGAIVDRMSPAFTGVKLSIHSLRALYCNCICVLRTNWTCSKLPL